MSARSLGRAGALSLAALAFAMPAFGQSTASVEVLPIFGEGCVPRTGPTELVVGVRQNGATTLDGTVSIESTTGNYQPGVRTVISVPFTAGPHARVTVRVPTSSAGLASDDSFVAVYDTNHRLLAQQPLHFENASDALFIDATPQSRLAFALRAANNPDPTALSAAPSPLAGLGVGLTPCPALRLPQTGDVVLPRTVAGYGGVTSIVLDGATVMALPATERVTLADYVLSGGTLIVIPDRPDELRHPTLAALVGAGVQGVTPPPLDPTNGSWLSAVPGSPPGTFPLPATFAHVESFQGGNLHTRTLAPMFPWGAPNLLGGSAEYGFGHVHVLTFNPTMPPALEDPFAVGVVTRLAQQAQGVRTERTVADTTDADVIPSSVRRALDPNEGFRPGLGFAVVALVLYAIFAGPVSFRLATRRKRPLRGLVVLPIASALLFIGIVVLGGVSRGFQGHARQFAVAELPAGMTRGSVRRFHGYYTGDAGGMSLVSSGHDRRMYVDPGAGTGYVTLSLERDRAQLRGVAITPWTTLVVREEAIETFPGSVTLQPDLAGRIRIVNRMNRLLRNVIIVAPGGSEAWSFPEIAAGQTRLAATGTAIPATALGALTTGSWYGGGVALAPGGADSPNLHPGFLLASLFSQNSDALRNWDALVGAIPTIGTFSTAEPVLIAQIDLPPRDETDGDLRVDHDVTFVRIVGWGGAP